MQSDGRMGQLLPTNRFNDKSNLIEEEEGCWGENLLVQRRVANEVVGVEV